VIRELVASKDYDRIQKIIQQLCNDYAYAVHQPHARNGGLIGLAAAAIALGPVCLFLLHSHLRNPLFEFYTAQRILTTDLHMKDLARYLDEIVPPVLACFTDQDARVRYYACESMYNIAKVAKGEVLPYFNDIFDALCKVRHYF
jgi:vacuole morphology and inheritance protein 14